jgi:hypothetical protein
LYGPLARYGGGRHVAQLDLDIPAGSTKSFLLEKLHIPDEQRGYVFVNSVLHEVPGLTTHDQEPLQEGDHIGIFSIDHMWPYQYRDGIPMSAGLKKSLSVHGAMHHTYKTEKNS